MRVGVIGINHKLACLKLREALAKACQRRFSLGQQHACVLLSTCNRTELYFSDSDLAQAHSNLLAILRREIAEEFDQRLYSYFGVDCFQHLCRVTAGLDSAIVAETEIQGQVKGAYEAAADCMDLPSEIHYLFQKALKIGKRVRSALPIKPGLPDLEHSIFKEGMSYFSNASQLKILCIGASEINKKIIAYLKKKQMQNITLCNRTCRHAHEVAAAYDIAMLNWNKLEQWHHFDWVIFGTKSPHYLITKEHIPQTISRKLVMDLSVPRNVDPIIAHDPRVTLLNIDELNQTLLERTRQLEHALHLAEEIVSRAALSEVETHKQRRLFAYIAN